MWQNSRKIHEEQVAFFPWPLRAKHSFRFIFLETIEAYVTMCVDTLLNNVALFFFFWLQFIFFGGWWWAASGLSCVLWNLLL